MSRRSQSPEGVGDLLKQDSFGGFDEDDPVNDMQDTDNPMNGESMYEEGNKEAQSFNGTGAQGDSRMDEGGINNATGKPSITRIPVPSFKGVSNDSAAGARSAGGRGPARYFIVKSNNTGNIEHSIKNGIWATQKHNEDKFVDAYKTASHVYLVFSVNMSGHFQGYAKMSGLPFRHQQGTWEGTSSVSNSFNVDWVRRYDLPFRETESMTNPLNENKPIKISRDGQELPLPLGLKICRMFDEGADANGVPRPPAPVRNPGMRAGPAVSGFGGGRGMGRGRGDHGGPPPGGNSGGLVPTPMGMVPAHMAMQMGMNNPMAMQGMFSGGMGGMDPMMMNMGGMDPMMGMNPMMAARMQMMGAGPGMGMNGMGGPGRGPVPPPKPPPPRSPPTGPSESELMQMMMKLRSNRMGEEPRGEEAFLLRALELTRGRSPRRDRRYRSRSRSGSPRRGRSRRRSRSRSRSRSRGRGRDRSMDLAYEDYLEAFKVMNRKKASGEGIDSRGGMASMMSQMQGMMGDGARGGNAGPGMMGANSMMKGQGGVNNMSEDEYVRVWENYSKMSGQPFDAQTVRGWYRQHKQYSASR